MYEKVQDKPEVSRDEVCAEISQEQQKGMIGANEQYRRNFHFVVFDVKAANGARTCDRLNHMSL